MKMTITDIAQIADVSVATVSRVINNKAKGVSEATRKRILSIISEYDFQPSAVARGLVTKTSNIIGLIIPDITNPFYPVLAKGVESAAAERGYNIILCDGGNLPEKEAAHLMFLNEHYVSGIIYNNFKEISGETLELIKKSSLPTVFVDSKIDTVNARNVYVDNQKAMREAVIYLYEMGHRSIAFLSGPEDSHSSIMRYKGYVEALEILNIPLDTSLYVAGEYELNDATRATELLLDRQIHFSALVCCNDIMAIGAYEAMERRNISVPDDISVIGFDDILLSRLVKPRLTTIHQPSYEMGYASANLLIDSIEGKNEKAKIVFDTELVYRDSVKNISNQ